MPPNTDKLGEHLSGYRVEIFDSLRGKRFNYTVNSSMTSADLDFLKPFTRYEFKVFGFTSSWEGNITDIISLKTQEDGRLKAKVKLVSPLWGQLGLHILIWVSVRKFSRSPPLSDYNLKI